MGIEISLQEPGFGSFEYITRSGIVRSHSNSTFTFLGNHRTVSYSGWTVFTSLWEYTRVSVSPHPHRPLLFSVVWIVATLMAARWRLTVALISISLMISGLGHSMLIGHSYIFFEDVSIRVLRQFWIELWLPRPQPHILTPGVELSVRSSLSSFNMASPKNMSHGHVRRTRMLLFLGRSKICQIQWAYCTFKPPCFPTYLPSGCSICYQEQGIEISD